MGSGSIRRGELLAAAGGAALLAALFTRWYDGASGWAAFAVLDVWLALIGVGGLAVAATARTQRSPAVPVATAAIVLAASLLALLLVLVRLAVPPDDRGLALGAALGPAAVAAVLLGAYLTLHDEQAHAGDPAVPVAHRPAPPASAPGSASAPVSAPVTGGQGA